MRFDLTLVQDTGNSASLIYSASASFPEEAGIGLGVGIGLALFVLSIYASRAFFGRK